MAFNDVDREIIRLRAVERKNNKEIRALLTSQGVKLGRKHLFTPEMVEECERAKGEYLASQSKGSDAAYRRRVTETKKEAIARVEEILGEEFGTSVEERIATAVRDDASGSAAFKIFEAKWGKADAKIVMEIAETRIFEALGKVVGAIITDPDQVREFFAALEAELTV